MSDPHTTPPADHSVKVPHLVFGLLFLGVAGLWAIGESGAISGERLTILGPAVLIGAGVIGLVASLATSSNRRRRRSTDESAYDAEPSFLAEDPTPDPTPEPTPEPTPGPTPDTTSDTDTTQEQS